MKKSKMSADDRRIWCLGSSQRLKILALLRQGYTIEEIARQMHTSQATISYHIRQLRQAGFLRWEGLGKYAVMQDEILEVSRLVLAEAGLTAPAL